MAADAPARREHDGDGDGAPGQEHRLASAEDTERPAVVLYVGEAEEARHERYAFAEAHRSLHGGLYPLVYEEDGQGEPGGEQQSRPAAPGS